jgi:hypothetical protein
MLFVLLTTTTPSTAGPLGILSFFICMYIAALGVLTFLFQGASLLLAKLSPMKRRKIIPGGLSLKKAYYYASVLALVPIMLLAMQSVGEIGMYQLLLVGFFTFIAWLYVANRTG